MIMIITKVPKQFRMFKNTISCKIIIIKNKNRDS